MTARCGTPSGYQKHRRSGEHPCDACALAKKEYDARQLAASGRTQKKRRAAKAQHLARTRLTHDRPDVYRTYYYEELTRLEREANQ